MPEVENYYDENMWGFIGDIMEFLIHTEVSLLVVVVLLLLGAIRELLGTFISRNRRDYDENS